jgi:hypothetical protein
MTRIKLLIGLLVLITLPLNGQMLKGKISNASGEPIPYASVYIRELKQGTTSNTKGDYEIRMPAGTYEVIYQSLGYSPVFYTANITDQTLINDVVLPLQYYQIPEVRISASGEDPAYSIMRKAVGLAPYYQNYISYFKAEVYLKGDLVIRKIPRLFQKAIKAEAKNDQGTSISTSNLKEGNAFMMESFNELEFTAPDKYKQKVISINSTFPAEGNNVSPMEFINASFYQPTIGNLLISPLSPQAFSYYRFRYLGASPQGSYTINKIQVIPKMKSQQLFEGTIFIIEDLWCLHSVDLINNNIAGKVQVEQVYVPVQDDLWMPVSHMFGIDFSMMGIKADVSYGGSVKYLEVKPNASLKKPESVSSSPYAVTTNDKVTEQLPVSRNQQKIEKILGKDELSNRDMVELSRLMNSESEKARPDSIRKNLEVKENVTRSVEKDANKQDSAYWAGIRPVPLSETELHSILIRDSIKRESDLRKSKSDSLVKSDQKKERKFRKTLNHIAFGNTWSDTSGFNFNYSGLLNLSSIRFNTVDGFTFGQDFRISKDWKNNTGFTIAPSLRWAFSREKLMMIVNSNYRFGNMKQSQLFFRLGSTSMDFSSGGSINPFLNSVTSLFMKRNYLKLYESKYLTLGFRTQIKNGLGVEIYGGRDYRRVLENTTSYAFIKSERIYSDNLPENRFLDTLISKPAFSAIAGRHFEFVTNVTFTPRQRYSIYNGAKVSRGSDWPTFSFTWKHGINDLPSAGYNYKQFDQFLIGASKTHDLGGMSELRWNFKAGGFADNRYVSFIDFNHYNAQPLIILLDDYQDAFRLPSYYSLSTPELFAEGHLKYTSPYLLLKYLPGLSKTLIRENLSFSFLDSRFHAAYTEIGYSLSEVLILGDVGIYAGFENLRYKNVGVRFILKFR